MSEEKTKKEAPVATPAPAPVVPRQKSVHVLVAVELFVDVVTQLTFRPGQLVTGWTPERIKLYLNRGLVRYEEQLPPYVEVK